jgi:transcriptional regulator with XRE-family HTH domain
VRAIRHFNLQLLIQRFGTIQKLADAVGKSHSQVSQLRNQVAHSTTGRERGMGDKLAREFEAKLGLEEGWMDQLHSLGTDTQQAPTDVSQVGLRVKAARELKHIGVADAAREAGLSIDDLARIEGGQLEPGIFVLAKLAKLYGQSIDALVWDVALSPEALEFAAEFDNLPGQQRDAMRAMMLAFGKRPVPDEKVEQHFGTPGGRRPVPDRVVTESKRPYEEREKKPNAEARKDHAPHKRERDR